MQSASSPTAIYLSLIRGWNQRDAAAMSACFTADGSMIGFDGSLVQGAEAVVNHLAPIFRDHPTPPYVVRIDGVRTLTPEMTLVRAEVGMVKPGESAIAPELNAWQTCLTRREDDSWRIDLLQTTPAAFHGRPDLVAAMTARLEAARQKVDG